MTAVVVSLAERRKLREEQTLSTEEPTTAARGSEYCDWSRAVVSAVRADMATGYELTGSVELGALWALSQALDDVAEADCPADAALGLSAAVLEAIGESMREAAQ